MHFKGFVLNLKVVYKYYILYYLAHCTIQHKKFESWTVRGVFYCREIYLIHYVYILIIVKKLAYHTFHQYLHQFYKYLLNQPFQN